MIWDDLGCFGMFFTVRCSGRTVNCVQQLTALAKAY